MLEHGLNTHDVGKDKTFEGIPLPEFNKNLSMERTTQSPEEISIEVHTYRLRGKDFAIMQMNDKCSYLNQEIIDEVNKKELSLDFIFFTYWVMSMEVYRGDSFSKIPMKNKLMMYRKYPNMSRFYSTMIAELIKHRDKYENL